MQVSVEDLAVFFIILQICVERNRWPIVKQVVVGPLLRGWLEERVPNEFCLATVGGSTLTLTSGGRAVHMTSSISDSTKGYPGEDVAP